MKTNIDELLFSFLDNHKLAVLSTVSAAAQSESAVLEFGQTDSLEIIFDCLSSSRKYRNLQTNPQVSLVIGWDDNITVQYEGRATELAGEEKERYQKIYWRKNPKAERWATREGIRYFKVTPTWIRYSDLNKNPWEITERTF